MVEPYALFEDVAAILAVCGVSWIVILFISRGLVWIFSALISGLLFLLLVIKDLAFYAYQLQHLDVLIQALGSGAFFGLFLYSILQQMLLGCSRPAEPKP
jgi:hypothetical protein